MPKTELPEKLHLESGQNEAKTENKNLQESQSQKQQQQDLASVDEAEQGQGQSYKIKKSVQALSDSSKSDKAGSSQNKENPNGGNPGKENKKPPGNTKMLVTDPYREKFVDKTNKKPTSIPVGPPQDNDRRFLSHLFINQKDADKKAQETREAAKRRIAKEKDRTHSKDNAKDRMIMSMVPGLPPTVKDEKSGKKDDTRPLLDITKGFQKLEKVKLAKARMNAGAKKDDNNGKSKKNQVAPSFRASERKPMTPHYLSKFSQTSIYEKGIDVSGQKQPQEVFKRKEITPEDFVTSAGQQLKLHELDEISGVFEVELLDGYTRKDPGESSKKNPSALGLVRTMQEEKEKEKQEFSKLEEFNIPNRGKIMTTLLETDFYTHNFNGLIRQYYSYVLRSYCLMNMQDRYRGLDKNAPCLSLIDISKLNTKDTEQQRRTDRALQCREENLQNLRAAARDSLHYRFLLEMTNNQSLTIPISIMHSILAETTPVVENVWRFYTSHLGKHHECTRQAGIHFVRLERRFEMYDHLGLGNGNINEY
ncbi:unnamed protein product [Allacma fusca]|uniref:Uncharacterized protein n=1 Tax=Allacma fusca TaxID=39272 RepID=A0A8J2L2V8_9HEXA|nr:unnamed protein product [Allacma fusca]